MIAGLTPADKGHRHLSRRMLAKAAKNASAVPDRDGVVPFAVIQFDHSEHAYGARFEASRSPASQTYL